MKHDSYGEYGGSQKGEAKPHSRRIGKRKTAVHLISWIFILTMCMAAVFKFDLFYYLRVLNLSLLGFGQSTHPDGYWQGNIHWVWCGDNIECGRFEVPLDYFDPSLGNASLAVARVPASNKTERLGTILTNPGGPGGSGVSFIHTAGKRLSAVVQGRYDIVSWDPRGVNNTLPRVECFATQTDHDIAFANTHHEMLPNARNLSDPVDLAAFKQGMKAADARNKMLGALCHERSGETLRHVGTATVVRDLERLYGVLEGEETPINYWGFSYGTVVGSYLVNMFPERIGKVVLDGNVDPMLWANHHGRERRSVFHADTDKVLRNFFSSCTEAGPDRCPLASRNTTAASISNDYDKLIANLYDHPLAVPEASRPGILTSSMIVALTFTFLYRPRDWPTLAMHLASAVAGNGTSIVEYFLRTIELNASIPARTSSAINAVNCVDGPDFNDESVEEAFEKNIDEMVKAQKQTTKHFSTLNIEECQYWKARETERFTGPFNHTLSDKILLIGNTADPVTPLRNSITVNKLLSNSSRLLVQDGSGHCSIALVSLCTAKTIRNYFLHGRLPTNGLKCPVDEVLFPPEESGAVEGSAWLKSPQEMYSLDDLRLLEVMRELGKELGHFISSFPS